MSKVPTPKEIPPTPQQVDRILQSVLANSQQLLAADPRHFANLRASFLAFYTHPTFQLVLGIPPQAMSIGLYAVPYMAYGRKKMAMVR